MCLGVLGSGQCPSPLHTLPPGRNPKSGKLAPERTVMQMSSVPGTLSSCGKENLPESQKHTHRQYLKQIGGVEEKCVILCIV